MNNKKTATAVRVISGLFLLVGVVVAGVLLWRQYNTPEPVPDPEPSSSVSQTEPTLPPSSSEPEPEPELRYPVGKFGPDQDRIDYVSGDMVLRVPRMDFEGPVYTSEEDITKGSDTYQGVNNGVLAQGVGLFGASQLPGIDNSNVSIAGHRDIYGKEFWDIDKMEEGDHIYLEYEGMEYDYLYESTLITHDNDWDPIRIKDYSAVTLQSCTPIYVATERIFVTGRLVAVKDLETGKVSEVKQVSRASSEGSLADEGSLPLESEPEESGEDGAEADVSTAS